MQASPQAKKIDYWPDSPPPSPLDEIEKEDYRQKIKTLLKEKKAELIAHYYVDAEIQRLAEETGGRVADSLEMARFGAESKAALLMVAGVRFMGETAKILSPDKKILMPTEEATCSLDLSCEPTAFEAFIHAHPGRTVVVYANTSATIKAMADWVVTSSIALDVIEHLSAIGQKIIWAPDRYLGHYIREKTHADMLLWQGSCIVHEEFKANALKALKVKYPDAAVLVHPESPPEVIALADVVGSTSHLLSASKTWPNRRFIVATDTGLFYKMQSASPEKEFIEAPTGGEGATCRSCGHCPWMALNSLQNLYESLREEKNEITVPEAIRLKALKALNRMIEFKSS